jgi:hypothetical protein
MKIEVTGIKELRESLREFSDRRFNAAVATALTRTAVAVRAEAQREMQASLDKPTPYTVRQLRYVAATADRPVAAVGFNVAPIQDIRGNVVRYQDLGPGETPAGKYLSVQQTGGQRRLKRLEEALKAAGALPSGWFIVPGQGAKIDAYGNVSRGQVIQVLAQLKLQTVSGTSRNMSQRSAIAAQRKAGGRFFVIPPGQKVQPGIYQREFIGRNIAPVFIFSKSASYRPRFQFDRVAAQVRDRELPEQLRRAIADASARLGRGGR